MDRTVLRFATLPVAVALAAATIPCFSGDEEPKTGLGFGPGMVVAGNLPLGKEVDANLVFEVHNNEAKAVTVTLRAAPPNKVGVAKWEKGYEAIPDGSWCRLEKEELEVPAKTIGKIKLFVTIPDKAENYNRKWMVGVACQKKASPTGGTGIALRLASRLGLETLPKTDTDGAGAGDVALMPSAMTQRDEHGGDKYNGVVKIRNNGKVARTYTPKRLTDVEAESEKHDRYFGPGKEPVLKETWLAPMEPVKIEPGETKDLKVTVTVPKAVQPGKTYEELIFLQDEAGRIEFVRVRTGIAAAGDGEKPKE